MARFPLQQPITLSTTVRNNADALVDAGTLTLLVKISNVDGTSSTTGTYSTPSHDSLGTYHQDIPVTDLAAAGHYQYTWTATGTGAGVSFGEFDVFDPFEPSVLPLQDAFQVLNITSATDQGTYGSEIASYVATIETSLERLTGGPLINRTISNERCEMMSSQSVILLRQRPVVSVTSIFSVASNTAIDISGGLDIDVNAGIIRRQFTGWPFILPTFVNLPIVKVTYVAGWGATVPAAFNTAARIILQGLWDTQHGPSRLPQMSGSEMVQMPGFSYLISPQAAEILEGSVNGMPIMAESYV